MRRPRGGRENSVFQDKKEAPVTKYRELENERLKRKAGGRSEEALGSF